jgi:peptidoglycan hydrolase-like protein with peptidoglycan-binding domain
MMQHDIGEYNSSAFVASSTNTAVVDNNVDVGASTGNNTALTENGAAIVKTGDAYAVANVTNLVNTNIVNGNWIFGVFNVFGDWSGDIAFGHPDLVLEAVAVTPEPTLSGSDIRYIFKVKNTGDMAADNIQLKATFDKNNLSVADLPEAIADASGGAAWNLGRLEPGQSREYAVAGRVSNPNNSSYTIPVTATVQSNATDNDPRDNTKLVTVVVNGPQLPQPSNSGGGGGGGGGGGSFYTAAPAAVWTKDPSITVTKSASMTIAQIPAKIDYKVVVSNTTSAGPAYNGVLTDVLYDPDGKVVYNRSWNLSTIASGDEITLTYSVEFASTTKPGKYHNVARVTGLRNYSTVGFGGTAISPVEVLGVTATAPVNENGACAAYLGSFLARGLRNNPSEVQKLQVFLNSQTNAGLPVTGTYGPLTTASVRAFQASQGIRPVSGSVYTLTQGAINRVMCGGAAVSMPSVPNTGGTTAAKAPAKTKAVAKTPAKAKTTAKAPAKKAVTPVVVKPVITPTAPAAAASSEKKSVGGWLSGLLKTVSAQSR